MKKFLLNNLEISSIDLAELTDFFEKIIAGEGSKLILTYNLDCLRNAEINESFKKVSQKSDIILPDGIGITLLLKLKYGKKIPRITGSKVFDILLSIGNKYNLKIAFLGSGSEVLIKVKERISELYPNVKIVSIVSPPYKFELNEEINNEIIAGIKEKQPDILMAALGNPRQELWLYKHKDEIGAKINTGVGAVFDFYSGNKKRAPFFLQNIGMEWLWRLVSEPGRLFKRYVIHDIPFFIFQSVKYLLK